jgi:hypothetical protein
MAEEAYFTAAGEAFWAEADASPATAPPSTRRSEA